MRRQSTHYDDLGRPDKTTTTLDRGYVSRVGYDTRTGALTTATYPSGFTLQYIYSTAGSGRLPGVLEKVADNADLNRIFWRIDNQTASQVFDARGQLLQAQLGNSVQVLNQFDPISGKALALYARTNTSLAPEKSDVLNQVLEILRPIQKSFDMAANAIVNVLHFVGPPFFFVDPGQAQPNILVIGLHIDRPR